jgi:protein-tyrosine phosphatase
VIDFRGAGERAKQPDILPAGAAYEALDPAADLARKAGEAQDKNGDEQKIARLLAAAASEEGRVSLQKNGMADQMRYLVTDSAAVKAYEVFFRRLEEDGSLPILFHCRGGKDRTGWAAALLLLLLGADRDCVKEDYLLTGELNRERNLRRMEEYRRYTSDPLVLDYLAGLQDARESYIDAAFAELDRVSAGPEDYVLRYFNLGPERVDALRSRFLEY